MANLTNNCTKSSSNYYYQSTKDVAARTNIQASAYVADAATMELKGYHFSTDGARGKPIRSPFLQLLPPSPTNKTLTLQQGPGGGFEVSSGIPSPPPSPPTGAFRAAQRPGLKARSRSGGAAYTITEECERLFCETLSTVFLGEGNVAAQDSLVMGTRNSSSNYNGKNRLPPTPVQSPDGVLAVKEPHGLVKEWVEIWDYTGGLRFRGFVAEKDGSRAMFVFFDNSVIGQDLKHGLMNLLELSSGDDFGCSQLVVCLDRTADPDDVKDLTRDLGWVGFELATLDSWSNETACTSDRWLLLSMDV